MSDDRATTDVGYRMDVMSDAITKLRESVTEVRWTLNIIDTRTNEDHMRITSILRDLDELLGQSRRDGRLGRLETDVTANRGAIDTNQKAIQQLLTKQTLTTWKVGVVMGVIVAGLTAVLKLGFGV